jgi:hypothetical protein
MPADQRRSFVSGLRSAALVRAAIACALLVAGGCGERGTAARGEPPASLPSFAAVGTGVTAIAVGDLAHQFSADDEVGTLMSRLTFSAFITLGDNAYPDGALTTYNAYWAPVFGRFDSLVRPTPGNHDYTTPGAAGYKEYFSAHAPAYPDSAEYYAYTLGPWRWYSLNSSIRSDTASAQYKWLRSELDSNPARCIAAYWHEPLYNAGQWGEAIRMRPIWNLLAAHHATLVLTGHDHDYQRWNAIDGITQLVVGTGGAGYHTLPDTITADPRIAMSATRVGAVLQMALEPGRVRFRLVTTQNKVVDQGAIECPAGP